LKFYLIAYGLFRFLTEFIRPELPVYLGLTFYQGVALAMVAGLMIQWWFDTRGFTKSLEGEPHLVGRPSQAFPGRPSV